MHALASALVLALAACAPTTASDRHPRRPADPAATAVPARGVEASPPAARPTTRPQVVLQSMLREGPANTLAWLSTTSGRPGFLAQPNHTEVAVIEAEAGRIVARVETAKMIQTAAVTPSGARVCVGFADGTRAVWGLRERRWLWQTEVEVGFTGGVVATDHACASVSLIGDGATHAVRVHDVETGAVLDEGKRPWPLSRWTAIEQTPARARALVRARADAGPSMFLVIDARTFEALAMFQAPCATFDPRGRLRVPADAVWYRRPGDDQAVDELTCPAIEAALFTYATPDGQRAFRWGSGELLDPRTGRRVRSFVDAELGFPHASAQRNARAEAAGVLALVRDPGMLTGDSHVRERVAYPRSGPHAALVLWPLTSPTPRVIAPLVGEEVLHPPSWQGGEVWLQTPGRLRRWRPDGTELAPEAVVASRDWHPAVRRGEDGTAIAFSQDDRGMLHTRRAAEAPWRRVRARLPFVPTAGFDLARTGDRWYVVGENELTGVLVMDTEGRRVAGTAKARPVGSGGVFGVSVSPDGRRVAAVITGGDDRGLWIYDLPLLKGRRISEEKFRDFSQIVWMGPRHVLVGVSDDGDQPLVRFDVDAGGPGQPLVLSGRGPLEWMADSGLLLQRMSRDGGYRVYDRDGRPLVSFGLRGDGWEARWPDGTFACERGGCAALRCTVDGESLGIEACAALRTTRPLVDPGHAGPRR